MADVKVTGLTELAAAPAVGDFIHIVDISDTTDDAAGTSKKITTANLLQRRTQTDNNNTISNTVLTGVNVQYGWGQILGNALGTLSESVTFPTAFTTPLGVHISFMGTAATTAATSVTDLTGTYTSAGTTGFTADAHSITTSGFTAAINRHTGSFSNTTYYAYSWIAWGV